MKEALLKLWAKMLEVTGFKPSGDHSNKISELIDAFIAEQAKPGDPKPGDPAPAPDALNKLLEEMKKLSQPPKPGDPAPAPAPTFDVAVFTAAIKETFKPVLDQVESLQKTVKEMNEATANSEKSRLKAESEKILNEAYLKGKLSQAQIKQFKAMFEKNYDAAKMALEAMPENAIVAKQNSKIKFSLEDAKPADPNNPTPKPNTNPDDIAKQFDIQWARGARPEILKHVVDTIQ